MRHHANRYTCQLRGVCTPVLWESMHEACPVGRSHRGKPINSFCSDKSLGMTRPCRPDEYKKQVKRYCCSHLPQVSNPGRCNPAQQSDTRNKFTRQSLRLPLLRVHLQLRKLLTQILQAPPATANPRRPSRKCFRASCLRPNSATWFVPADSLYCETSHLISISDQLPSAKMPSLDPNHAAGSFACGQPFPDMSRCSCFEPLYPKVVNPKP